MTLGDLKCPICGGPLDRTEKKKGFLQSRMIYHSCSDETCGTLLFQVYDENTQVYGKIILNDTKKIKNPVWMKYGGVALTANQWAQAANGQEPTKDEPSQSPTVSSRVTFGQDQTAITRTNFGVLLGYGSLQRGLGWFLVVLAFIVGVIGLAVHEVGAIVGIAGAIILGIAGIGFVVSGEAISCFVSIDRNTKVSAELLERLLNESRLREK